MLLTLDVGNTNVTIGVFDGERAARPGASPPTTSASPTSTPSCSSGCLAPRRSSRTDITGAVMACVVPELATGVRAALPPLLQGRAAGHRHRHARPGVRILYDNPREVGADRIVDVVAGSARIRPAAADHRRCRHGHRLRRRIRRRRLPRRRHRPGHRDLRPRRSSSAPRSSTGWSWKRRRPL